MKNKKLLGLAVLPLMLASCGGADFNMYDQTIRYSAPSNSWEFKSSATGETAKKIFTDYFSKIDWANSSPVAKHDNAEVAMKSVSDAVSTSFKAKYENYQIKTGSKGSDPKVCGATLTLNGKDYVNLHFIIEQDQTKTQNKYVFLNDKDVDVASLTIVSNYNHSITASQLAIGSTICGERYTFTFTEEIPEIGKIIYIDFYAYFAS